MDNNPIGLNDPKGLEGEGDEKKVEPGNEPGRQSSHKLPGGDKKPTEEQKKFEEGCAETKKKQEDAKKKQEEDRKAEETKRTVVFNGKDFKIIGTDGFFLDGFFLHTQSYFLLFRSPFFTKVECLPAKLLNFLDELNIT
jgi:hypothetical protein